MNNGADKKKSVIITGATKGLGKELSLLFGRSGYIVIGIYRSDLSSANETSAEFSSLGLQGVFIKQDIAEDGVWPELDGEIKALAGTEVTLIANASAPFIPRPFHLTDWKEFSDLLDVNVKGTFMIFRRLLPIMSKARRGTLISVLTEALEPVPKGFSAYVTAKSALDGLTKSIAAEFSSKGLRCFSVSPGFMATALTAGWNEQLKSLVTGNAEPVYSPADYAAKILKLAESVETKGHGENYVLGS